MWEHLSDAALDIFILNSTLTSTSFLKKHPKYTTDDQCRLTKLLDDKTMIGEDRNELSVVMLPHADSHLSPHLYHQLNSRVLCFTSSWWSTCTMALKKPTKVHGS